MHVVDLSCGRAEGILKSLDHQSWNSRWLEVLAKENERGFHPTMLGSRYRVDGWEPLVMGCRASGPTREFGTGTLEPAKEPHGTKVIRLKARGRGMDSASGGSDDSTGNGELTDIHLFAGFPHDSHFA